MSGYTRTMGSPGAPAIRDSTIPRFHMEAITDEVASAAQGRPIFVQQERVQFIQPGNTNSPVAIVTDEHRQRWPEQYDAFKRNEEWSVDGTPLEQWPFLKKVNVLELKAMGVFSVEQAAGLSDAACQRIGMGGQAIRQAAAAYLDDAQAMAIVSEAISEREKAETRAAHAEKQLAELRPMVESMHAELMALKNAAPPTETFIQGMHDPVQQAMRAAPLPPPAASSLDALAGARRPRQKVEAAA